MKEILCLPAMVYEAFNRPESDCALGLGCTLMDCHPSAIWKLKATVGGAQLGRLEE